MGDQVRVRRGDWRRRQGLVTVLLIGPLAQAPPATEFASLAEARAALRAAGWPAMEALDG